MNLPVFNHKLYGKAVLMPNQSFKVYDIPKAINYLLLEDTNSGDIEVRSSGIRDAGLNDNKEVLSQLKELGY